MAFARQLEAACERSTASESLEPCSDSVDTSTGFADSWALRFEVGVAIV